MSAILAGMSCVRNERRESAIKIHLPAIAGEANDPTLKVSERFLRHEVAELILVDRDPVQRDGIERVIVDSVHLIFSISVKMYPLFFRSWRGP